MSLMWSAVEVNIGITCACIPTLKPLIIRILPAMLVDPDGTRRSRTNTLGSSQLMDSGSKQESSSEGSGSQPATTNTATTRSQLDSPRELLAAARTQGSGNRMSEEVDIMDFLAGGGSGTGQGSNQRTRASMLGGRKVSTVTSNQENAVYFGFVNLKKPKSMLKTSAGESLKYCTVVSILFFLWGFSYGLLNTLNNVVADVANMSQAQTLGLTSIYFGGGYFFGPLVVGEWLLRHDEHHRTSRRRDSVGGQSDSVGGFKTTFIVGLLIYGTGTIMFWPSAVLTAYGGFMISSFVVGFGLAVLETAANPFLALCGPPEYADARLLVAQGVQGVGSVLSGLLANNVFFSSIECAASAGDGSPNRIGSTTLLDVQWTYLAVTLLCVLLALFFYYMPLPEVSDRELGRLAEKLPVDPKKRSIGGLQLRTWCLILAVASQWTYVAAQEIMSIFFHSLITAFIPSDNSVGGTKPPGFALSVLDYLSVAHTAFAVSRFGAGCLAYLSVTYPTNRFIPTPRTILSACAGFSALFILIAVVLKPTNNPNMMAVPVILFFLAEGPMWPLIFSLGLRGQGRRTKRAAAFLTMGASGPMFWPFVSYAIGQRGGSIQTAFIVVIVLMAFSLTYPLFLTFVKDAKAMVDPFPGEHDNQQSRAGSRSGNGGGMLARRGSAATVLGLEHIIAQRQRARSTAPEQVPRRGSDGVFGKWAGRWERRQTASSANTGTSPIVEHHESQRYGSNSGSPPRSRQESQHHQPPQNQLQTESAAPWEDQVLDG
ncbi:major facilitator superfamily domain-containing protein [Diplogelasinospora grovesii]|uniref:Major facilitator superfamily domain-containing protein n=1 Tax=Diplogelasinospora grovesii TaxID=303347 RepID=A0AAN6NAQ6_9PEZI|nr:major facilitator superfamily domain-containing protein [Diplogelasinospora grovesii]